MPRDAERGQSRGEAGHLNGPASGWRPRLVARRRLLLPQVPPPRRLHLPPCSLRPASGHWATAAPELVSKVSSLHVGVQAPGRLARQRHAVFLTSCPSWARRRPSSASRQPWPWGRQPSWRAQPWQALPPGAPPQGAFASSFGAALGAAALALGAAFGLATLAALGAVAFFAGAWQGRCRGARAKEAPSQTSCTRRPRAADSHARTFAAAFLGAIKQT